MFGAMDVLCTRLTSTHSKTGRICKNVGEHITTHGDANMRQTKGGGGIENACT